MAKQQAPEHIGIQTLQAYAEVKQESFSASTSDRTLWPLPQDWDQLTWFGDAEHEMVVASRPLDIGDGVRIRMLHRVNRTVEMALIIDEKLTIENIKDKWSELKRFVLPNPTQMDTEIGLLRWTYVRLYEAGVGQAKLAEQVNEDILLALCFAVVEERRDEPNRSGLSIAHSLMRALEIKHERALEEVIQALEDLRLGRLPWNAKQGPVSRYRMRQMIDHYRARPETDETLLSWYSLIERVRQGDSQEPLDAQWQEAVALRKKCTFFG